MKNAVKSKTEAHRRRWMLRLFEWGVLVCIIASLYGMFLNRMGRVQAEIERQNFLTTVRTMQAAVLLQSVIRPGDAAPGDNPAEVYRHQFGLLPTGYVGQLERPDPASVAGGGWYFDTKERQLVYRVRSERYFQSNLQGPPRMRLKLIREDGSGRLTMTIPDGGDWTVGKKEPMN